MGERKSVANMSAQFYCWLTMHEQFDLCISLMWFQSTVDLIDFEYGLRRSGSVRKPYRIRPGSGCYGVTERRGVLLTYDSAWNSL